MPRYQVSVAVPKILYFEVEVKAPDEAKASEAAIGFLINQTIPDGTDVIESVEVDESTEDIDVQWINLIDEEN